MPIPGHPLQEERSYFVGPRPDMLEPPPHIEPLLECQGHVKISINGFHLPWHYAGP